MHRSKTISSKKAVPAYRRHASGQARVTINGRDHYLGKYKSPESVERYQRLLGELTANNGVLLPKTLDITILELCAADWRYAEDYYRKPDGSPTSSLERVGVALKPLRRLHGSRNVNEFGPRDLINLQTDWAATGLHRGTVNQLASTIKRVFKWGVTQEMVVADTFAALSCVSGIRARRSPAKESEPVRPAPLEHVAAVKPFVSRQVWSLIQLQLNCGARPGELVKLRPIDFDMTGDIWAASLEDHKNAHRGKTRCLHFGPKSQEILRSLIHDRPVQAYLFCPREAERERAESAPTHRRPDQEASPRKTSRMLGDHYTVSSYRKAIGRACTKAGVPKWTPNQLRHNYGTQVRSRFGLDAAQVVLGHASANVTEIYAELDTDKASKIASIIG